MPPLRAPRLSDGSVRLRPLAERDVPAIVAACADADIVRWTSTPAVYTAEDARRLLAVAATTAAAGSGLALAVTGAGDRLIGTIGLARVSAPGGGAEIGYWLAAGARGRGVATRAVVLVRDWAHAQLGLAELVILSHRDNLASAGVALRAGFADTGALVRAPHMPRGRREDYRRFVWRAATPTASLRGGSPAAGGG
jgi:RimJ/RimL family protein N-acetyltransferase